MKTLFFVFLTGVLFALGLGISGMTDGNKVVGFLNLAGEWDPSLGFVMVGAICVHVVFQRLMQKRGSPLYGEEFERPPTHELEVKLVVGSGIFGVGWALSGYCPGPAVVSTTGGGIEAIGFTVAMLLGMVVYNGVNHLMASRN